MRFTILIPTFNRADMLRQAIDAALAQSYLHREILVVDDGSTDHTQSVVTGYGRAVRYLRKENGGKPSALNLGISASEGEVIIVLDDDDLFPSSAVAKHAEALSRNPAADFSYGRFVRFQGTSSLSEGELLDMEFVPTRDPRRLVIKLMENCFLPNPTFAVRREAQLKAGPYDDHNFYSPDYDAILRLSRKNEGIFIDDVVLYQRKHTGYRGPTAERTFILDTVDKWVKYDTILFNRLDKEWDLSDFRPFSGEVLSKRDEALALLQKGVILFQRKAYAGAMRALGEYRRDLDGRWPSRIELRIATGLLSCRYGINDLLAKTGASREIMEAFKAKKWPHLMRAAFAAHIRWRIRAALTANDVDSAFKLGQFALRTFGVPATAMVLGSRYAFGARQWRSSY
jgi:glycosyltransferase involved in cell wall biosynthesis